MTRLRVILAFWLHDLACRILPADMYFSTTTCFIPIYLQIEPPTEERRHD